MYVQITVNQLLFTCEKFSREPGHREYFSPRIGPCPIILIITLVLIRLCRENLSSWTSSSRINHEIKLLRIKVGVQHLLLYQHYSCCSRKLLVKKKFFFLFRCIKRSFFFFLKLLCMPDLNYSMSISAMHFNFGKMLILYSVSWRMPIHWSSRLSTFLSIFSMPRAFTLMDNLLFYQTGAEYMYFDNF